jgi:hypothetical protein
MRPPGRASCFIAANCPFPFRRADELEEDADHPVEGVVQFCRWPLRPEHVGQQEAGIDLATGGKPSGLFDGHRRDFNRADLEPLFGQPDRLPALAIGHRQRSPAILQEAKPMREKAIRLGTEQVLLPGIPVATTP